MNPVLKKSLLILLAVLCLLGSGLTQNALNTDRARLGLTRMEPLDNAPPVLAFTTVALGGFRGLISNALWIRMNKLQEEDKFFEMKQLGDWITKLQPTFVQVWTVQAWNMAYNISVKFQDAADRWRWVRAGLELLRDNGLRYHPNELLIYRELAWFFQHKMGQNLDDAHNYYKTHWALEDMARVFGDGKARPSLEPLLNPQTDEDRARLATLKNVYKMDPKLMQKLDEEFGPLDWRLPEAHAIYWYARGLQQAEANPGKIKQDDLMTLRRGIYQSMLLAFQRGRLVLNPHLGYVDFRPNLDIIPRVEAAYKQAMEDEPKQREHIQVAHRNFLLEAVAATRAENRNAAAARLYEQIKREYPNKPLFGNDTNSLPANMTYDEFALRPLQEVATETDRNKVAGLIQGLLEDAYFEMLQDEDERGAAKQALARHIREVYMSKVSRGSDGGRVDLPPLAEFDQLARDFLLGPQSPLPEEARAALRTKLNLPAAEPPPAPGTNAPPVAAPAK
jgi:hypothetical protein